MLVYKREDGYMHEDFIRPDLVDQLHFTLYAASYDSHKIAVADTKRSNRDSQGVTPYCPAC